MPLQEKLEAISKDLDALRKDLTVYQNTPGEYKEIQVRWEAKGKTDDFMVDFEGSRVTLPLAFFPKTKRLEMVKTLDEHLQVLVTIDQLKSNCMALLKQLDDAKNELELEIKAEETKPTKK